MTARTLFAIIMLGLIACLPLQAKAQGYGGLGSQAEGYEVPQRGQILKFPGDHGAHPGFRIEWWYLTANLEGDDGRQYGAQWTLFRSALMPPDQAGKLEGSQWQTSQLWMGHAAVTTPDKHYVSETRSRGVHGIAGVQAFPFKAWINDWQMVASDSSNEGLNQLNLRASGANFAYDLNLNAEGPLVFHGDQGFSVKSAGGQASHYYSQPFYRVQGELDLPSGKINVTGSAWLDREWSSQPLSQDQHGWDWVSLNFHDGGKLMGFRLRQSSGENFTSATWIAADGTSTSYANNRLRLTELARTETADRELPTTWRVELPEQGVDATVQALNKDTWMDTSFPYWEGPVTISGSHSGAGYLEMTGYE